MQQAHKLQLACSARENSARLFSQHSIIDPQHKQTKCQTGTERHTLSLSFSHAISIWRKLSLRDSGTVTSYDNNSTHLCHMDQAKPSIATHQQQQQKRKRQQLRGMPRPSPSTPCSCLLLPVTLLLRPRQLRLGIVYVFVSASLPAAVAVPVPVSVAALPLAACLCLPPSAAKCDIFARLISDRTCHSSSRCCVFRFLQHIPRQKGFAFVSA